MCLFLVWLSNKIYKLKWACLAWIGLQVSEVAEYSSFKREWTRNNGWKEVEEEEEEEEDDDDVGSEEEEEEEEEEEDDDDDC